MDKTDKRRKYDEAFKAEALRVARESCSTQASARALNIRPKLLYEWQKAAHLPLPADPAEAAEVRQLRAANRRLKQELKILKKPSPSSPPYPPDELLSIY
jgi:transposase